MRPWQRILAAVMSACAVALAGSVALPARALASDTQSTILTDDDQLIYQSPAHAIQVLQKLRTLGVDQVKVSMYWALVAPNPTSRTRPNFDATNPNAYPDGAWSRYDVIVREAAKLGMSVYFMLQGQTPTWARAPGRIQGPPLSIMPRLSDWQQFVQAVAKRYSGSFVPAGAADTGSAQPISILGIPLGPSGSSAAKAKTPLPRVNFWEIWNEPNERSWLSPWYRLVGGRKLYTQPSLYRSIVDTTWSALHSTGHGGDTILVGETANVGRLDPMPFLRALYCVGRNNLPLSGAGAAALFCPTTPNPGAFVAAHPGLFNSSGYAHHPYAFDVAPNKRYGRGYVTLQNIGTMETALNQIFSAYGVSRPGGVPMYLTEWGYESNPPNPFVHTSIGQQEVWLNEGEYMTWQDPYIKALTQFELVDNPGKAHTVPGSRLYWSTFQTGLEYSNGTPKPSFYSFQIPIWLPRAVHGSNITVWGQLRPADHTTIQYGLIQYAAAGGSFKTIAEPQTTSSEGFLVTHVNIPGPGRVRLAWLDPFTGVVDYSRTVKVS
ncbi:MAG: hypothetical protein ACYDHH_09055 [Solirubrobacteraceae bacterium]